MKKTVLHRTKIDLAEKLRKTMIALLNARLADSIDLKLRAKNAHWNVKGPRFLPLHGLFDKVASAADEWGDLLAERAAQLGGVAEGLAPSVMERATLGEYPWGAFEGREFVYSVSGNLAVFGRHIRGGIDLASKAGDQTTADLLTEISRDSDKYLWLVEAHLQGE